MPRKSRLESEVEGVDAIYGLTTVYRDYRVAHFVNQALSLELASRPDIPVYSARLKRLTHFSFYTYYDNDLRTDYFLISNTNEETRIIPEMKQINYLLLIKGAAPQEYYSNLLPQLRTMSQINSIRLQPESIKDLTLLIQDLEIHLVEINLNNND
jgi:hypothetical protein